MCLSVFKVNFFDFSYSVKAKGPSQNEHFHKTDRSRICGCTTHKSVNPKTKPWQSSKRGKLTFC